MIGEAASKLPEGFKRKYRSVPWQAIKGLRNRLIPL
ncbi:HepT-like ribonuclease domain-containing protein [Thermovibrio sp.]